MVFQIPGLVETTSRPVGFIYFANLIDQTRIPRRAVSHLPQGGGVGVGGGGGGGGGAQVQHQLYSIVWDVLTQSIYKG